MKGHPSFCIQNILAHNSGTPIVGIGGEIFNILEIIAPGRLGTETEFRREWCSSYLNGKWIIKNPDVALGAYLRREFLMLRRTLHDVKAQIPQLNTTVHTIPYNPHILKDAEKTSLEPPGSSSREATPKKRAGIPRAGHENATSYRYCKSSLCRRVRRMFLEDNTPIILAGWHRSVYSVWMDLLKEFNPVMFTGSESPKEKEEAQRKFMAGETNCFIMSLRSGAGLDGLQERCATVIFGEIDWSRAIHEQVIFRVNRDGQKDPVGAYYLLADGGSDPIISQILGIKSEQADGVLDLFQKQGEVGEDTSRIKALAEHLLKKHKVGHKKWKPEPLE